MSAPQRVDDWVVVGRGRVGTLLAALAERAGQPCETLGRGDLPGSLARPIAGTPIVVCTRNDDLEGLLGHVAPQRRADLVFVQNGMLLPWLGERRLDRCTQGLLYVAVPKVGARPEPGGESLFWGPHAEQVAALLRGGGIAARATTDAQEYRAAVAYKFAWNAVFGLLGEATGQPVGALAAAEAEAVRALCAEMTPVLATALEVDLKAGPLAEHALAYAREIPDYRATLKEQRWRNGWLVQAAEAQAVALPQHAAWLARAGAR